MLATALVACGQSAPKGGCNSNADCPTGATCSSYACNAATSGEAGMIAGSANGAPFSGVASAFLIGAPDSASTQVVYLFSIPVECSVLGSTGWDTRVPTGAHALELKMLGSEPATYGVTPSATPAAGEASVNATLAGNEQAASGGSVVLETLSAGASASGHFSVQLDTESLTGSFVATFCADGHEP